MSSNIHHHYNQLTEEHKRIVDLAYEKYHESMHEAGLEVTGDDRAERVVDAMAKHVVESGY